MTENVIKGTKWLISIWPDLIAVFSMQAESARILLIRSSWRYSDSKDMLYLPELLHFHETVVTVPFSLGWVFEADAR